MTFFLAHAGHWLVNLLYMAPVVIVVGWLSVRAIADRRRERREAAGSAPPPAP